MPLLKRRAHPQVHGLKRHPHRPRRRGQHHQARQSNHGRLQHRRHGRGAHSRHALRPQSRSRRQRRQSRTCRQRRPQRQGPHAHRAQLQARLQNQSPPEGPAQRARDRRSQNVFLPLTAQVQQMLSSLIADGKGDFDHSAIATFVEVPRTSKSKFRATTTAHSAEGILSLPSLSPCSLVPRSRLFPHPASASQSAAHRPFLASGRNFPAVPSLQFSALTTSRPPAAPSRRPLTLMGQLPPLRQTSPPHRSATPLCESVHPAAQLPLATLAFAVPTSPNAKWVRIFERLNRRVQRIRHMCVHAADPVHPWPRAHPARRRLVVRKRVANPPAPPVARRSIPPIVTLLIVPALAAGTRSGTAFASARISTFTIRCDVSTFPPAGWRAETWKHRSGLWTC